ncbi:unnamed protein product [Blumeria hordei]|uniref:Uncharacterized protein n=1 Tax=Blumeria hordei TaxID=2867405 RepID=A0A383URF6_BLUHO|nr:unnamed protein product [Blumeria hordei]
MRCHEDSWDLIKAHLNASDVQIKPHLWTKSNAISLFIRIEQHGD